MENQYSYYNPDDHQQNGQNEYQNQGGNQGWSHGHEPREPKEKKKMPRAVAVVGLALLFGGVSSAVFLTSNLVGSKVLGLEKNTESKETASKVSGTTLTKSSSVVTSDVSGVVENVMPSVVSITNLSVQEVQNFFGGVSQQESESAGSGIIISQTDEELLIVTNYHVIAGSETLTVTFDDETSLEANIKGTDSEHDLAVIAVPLDTISSDTMEAIAVATLGDSTKLQIGEPAIVIGNALGYGQSVTTGVISALNRQNSGTDAQTGEEVTSDIKLIQTDAAINPGNSGGALVNANGEVVGINSSKIAGTTVEGMGYAIPISDVMDILDNLMSQKTKAKVPEEKKGYLGITGFDVTAQNAEQFGMPTGVYIDEVTRGGGADDVGLTKGNVITAINGTRVESMDALKSELEYYAAGETVSVTVSIPENNGEYSEKTVDVTLGKAAK